jgi:hypothetical protein
MDEKHAVPMPPPIRRGFSPLRLAVAIGYLALVAVTYFCFRPQSSVTYWPPSPPVEASITHAHSLVPLEAHIMSKCPDARVGHGLATCPPGVALLTPLQDCLRDMVLPAMQKVHDKVNFTLSFIGKYACHPI